MSENHGAIWWSELMTRDLKGALDYYGKVAGWTFTSAPMMDGYGEYHMARQGEKMIAGIMDMTGMEALSDVPPHWLTYIAVDDIAAAVAGTRDSGGQVLRDVFEVPNAGRIAIVADPGGAAVGLIEPAPQS